MLVVYVLLAALVTGGAWYVDVRLRPWKPCPSCHGRKRTTAYGKHHCRRCGGSGEVRRVGAGRER
jgi:DnaJ-class molecular chaperone